jgi:hypothetical protein
MTYGPFTAWESLFKSLGDREQIAALAELLASKSLSSLEFTALEPSGGTRKYYLGSSDGNTKFLLGFCSPGFYLAPWHFRVIDPSLSDSQAEYFYEVLGHPSKEDLWVEAGVLPEAEGDFEEGTPHPFFGGFREAKKSKDIKLDLGGASHILSVDNRTLVNLGLEVSYPLDIVEASPQYYWYPELKNQMESFPKEEDYTEPFVEDTEEFDDTEESPAVFKGMDFSAGVFPLVKTAFPKPGTVLSLGNEFNALVTPASIKFLTKSMKQGYYSSYDLESLSLIDDDNNVTSDLLADFASEELGIKEDIYND